LNSITNM